MTRDKLKAGAPIQPGAPIEVAGILQPTSTEPKIASLIAVVEAGLRVLKDRDRLPLSDALIRERARNIATALLGLYDVRAWPA